MDKLKKLLFTLLCFLSIPLWILIFIFCFVCFSSIGFIILIILFIIFTVLKKNHKRILIIIPFILILIIVSYSLLAYKIEILYNWNKIKNDYELINSFVIDYYNNNCENECYIYFDKKYEWFDDNSYYVDKLDLNNDLRNAIKNISEYQKKLNYPKQGLSYIKINSNQVRYISYIDARPPFFVIYSRTGENLSEYHFDCYYNECNSHLTDKWYQNYYEHQR